MVEVLGIIPARGGSKSIPHKNIAPLCGRPLIAYTAEAALRSCRLTRIVVSTDDEEIAATCRVLGLDVPFLRPASISADDAPMLAVLRHTLTQLDSTEGYRPGCIVLLQPTSPLRTHHHIDEAVELFIREEPDSVVSVMEVPHQFNPVSVLKIVDGKLIRFMAGEQILRRQDKPPVYARNGPAVLVCRSACIAAGRLYGENSLPYLMKSSDSIDVDSMEDLAFAELLISRRPSA